MLTFKVFFSGWLINKNEKTAPIKINLYETRSSTITAAKMSKILHTHKVSFHKNVSQPPSQRYDFENNNGRNPGNEVA